MMLSNIPSSLKRRWKKIKEKKFLKTSFCAKMDPHRMLLINTTTRSPTFSEVSPTPSLDSTGSDPLKYLVSIL
jgi:hypothetical protein